MIKEKVSEFLLNIIRFATYFSLLTPIIINGAFFFPFVGPKSLFFMTFSEIIFFSWLVLINIDRRYRPKFNLITLSLIIYLIIFILASLLGVNPSYSFWSKFERMTGILMQLHLFVFFLVLSSVFLEDDFKKFFLTSNIIAVLVSLFALVNLENPQFRGGGTIGNESFLGTYLLFNCFFAIYLILNTKDFFKRFSIILFSFLFFALLFIGVGFKDLSFSQKISNILFSGGARAAKISFYGGIILLFFLWLIFASQRKLFKIFGFVLLSFSLFLGFFGIISLIFYPEGNLVKYLEKELGSFGGRFPVWRSAIQAIKERPILGWGPENFEFAFEKYFNPCMGTPRCGGEIWFDRAHNIIFDTLISTGILGMITYLFIFASSFFVLLRNYQKNKISFSTFGIFTSLLVSYFVQNLTVFDMISSYLMFFLSLTFIGSFEKEKKFIPEINTRNPLILATIFTLFLLSFLKFIILPARSGMAVISAIRSPAFSEQKIDYYKKALSSSLGKFQIRQFFTETAINSLDSVTVSTREIKKEIDFLTEELEKSIKECPLDYRSYLRLGQLLTVSAQFDRSKIPQGEEILRKTIEISPTNQQGYWSLAQNFLFQGRVEEAISLAQKALDLEPNLESSHNILIQILVKTGNFELAKEKYEEAIKINPEWANKLKALLNSKE